MGASLVLLPGAAHADVSYTGHAEAYGFRTTATNDAFPLGFVFEGDAPIATADLSSLGDSQALAAGPYPGTTAASVPGAVGGVIGFPLPNYPVVAQAGAGDEPVQQNLPGLALRADAGTSRAQGIATIGSAAQGAESQALVDGTKLDTEGVTAEGRARLEGLALLDYLHFQRVLSVASTTLDPQGERRSRADLRIDGITAPGLSFAAPEQTPASIPLPNPAPGLPQPPSLQFPPAPVPGGGVAYGAPELSFRNEEFVVTWSTGGVEQSSPVPFRTVAEAFKAIGVTVTYQAAQPIPDGILAPTLTFLTELPAPPSNPFGVQSATPVTLELGRASASLRGALIPAAAVGDGLADGLADGSSGEAAPGTVDAATGALPMTAPGAAVLPDAALPTVASNPRVVALTGDGAPWSPFTDLYVLFVVVAAGVLMSVPALTVLRARLRWAS